MGRGNRQNINYVDFLSDYNKTHNTRFATVTELFKHEYALCGSWPKVEKKLGISRETIRKKMQRDNDIVSANERIACLEIEKNRKQETISGLRAEIRSLRQQVKDKNQQVCSLQIEASKTNKSLQVIPFDLQAWKSRSCSEESPCRYCAGPKGNGPDYDNEICDNCGLRQAMVEQTGAGFMSGVSGFASHMAPPMAKGGFI